MNRRLAALGIATGLPGRQGAVAWWGPGANQTLWQLVQEDRQ